MMLPLMNTNKLLKVASTSSGPGGDKGTPTPEEKAYTQCTIEHGFQYKYWYQPAESGIYVFMSALLFALTFWWTKYRIIGK